VGPACGESWEFHTEVVGETVVGAGETASEFLLKVAGEEVAGEGGGLRLGNSEELDADQVVREHVAAGDSVALALDFV
jgi:hypothetical protein